MGSGSCLNPRWLTLKTVRRIFLLRASLSPTLFYPHGGVQTTLLDIVARIDETEQVRSLRTRRIELPDPWLPGSLRLIMTPKPKSHRKPRSRLTARLCWWSRIRC